MSYQSLQKLLDAGYVCYRSHWDQFEGKGKITYMAVKGGNWKQHSKDYPTKAALERKMKELIETEPKALDGL